MAHPQSGYLSAVSVSNWNLEMLVRDENQQQTQPTYDAESRNQTWATLVGGEHSHHCAIPAPHNLGDWVVSVEGKPSPYTAPKLPYPSPAGDNNQHGVWMSRHLSFEIFGIQKFRPIKAIMCNHPAFHIIILQSTLALQTPRYHGHPNNMDIS